MRNRILLAALLVISSFCMGLSFSGQTQTHPQYEYRFVQMKLDFKKTDVALTDLGAEGWEAYAVTENNGIANFYLKRARP